MKHIFQPKCGKDLEDIKVLMAVERRIVNLAEGGCGEDMISRGSSISLQRALQVSMEISHQY